MSRAAYLSLARRGATTSALVWSPALGVGYRHVTADPSKVYDDAYLAKYDEYAETALGDALTSARAQLVLAHAAPRATVLDIGCAAGCVVNRLRARGLAAYGHDVIPAAVKRLGPWGEPDPLRRPPGWFTDATFFDSLEHIPEPWYLLDAVASRAYVSIPVFTDDDDVLASRHYRPDEHYWYFTRLGFIRFADALGWECVALSDMETREGRESIATFTLYRREAIP